MMYRLKAYINGRLYRSVPFSFPFQLVEPFLEILRFNPSKVYYCQGSHSREIHSNSMAVYRHPISYTHQNGVVVRTIPIDLKAYPVTVHWSDGSESVIDLA